MRPNRFFSDLYIDTSYSVQWLIDNSEEECSEAYILKYIEECNGNQQVRVYSHPKNELQPTPVIELED